jgi:beta-1,4-mannosyltransferase
MRAAVVVLGDIGRSPRMCYHAEALAAHGVDVDVVGYVESPLPDSIRQHPRIAIHAVADDAGPAVAAQSRRPYLLRAAWRGMRLLVRLIALLLWRLDRPDVILVQNPPGVPALAVAWLAARRRSARLIIDWHNFTHAMLALRVGRTHWFVRLVERHERWMGRRAAANLFVSAAMQRELAHRWGLRGIVFRDRPAPRFQPIPAPDRLRVRRDLCDRLGIDADGSRLVIAVSPTSWTADEDFGLLLDAIVRYEARVAEKQAAGPVPVRLVILMTGRGPLRDRFEQRLQTLRLSSVLVRTLWLESGEYPTVLAASDLGISLHRSASGLDLPMKIADMFGVGLPVCALNYGPCLTELVRHGENGLLFSTADELAGQLCELVGEAGGGETLARLAAGVPADSRLDWQAAWVGEVWPVVGPK